VNYAKLIEHASRSYEGGECPLHVKKWVDGTLYVELLREGSFTTNETWVEIRIPAPEVVEVHTLVLNGQKVRTCVLKTGPRTRRIAQAGIQSLRFGHPEVEEKMSAHLEQVMLDAAYALTGQAKANGFDVWSDIEFVGWDRMWLDAVLAACKSQLSAPMPLASLIQGHFDKIVGGLVRSQKVLGGAHQTEVWANSLACLVSDWKNVSEIKYLAAIASYLGYELGATPKSKPGKEFLSSEYVRRMSYALGGFSIVDHRGERELSSGLRNAQRVLKAKGNDHLPEVWRDRVTYLNAGVAHIPGVTSSYAGKANTGGQFLLLGDSDLKVAMTRTTILMDKPTESIIQQAEAFGLSEAQALAGLEVTQVGGGTTRSLRVVADLPNPQLVKLSVLPFGPKGMATRTSRRFVEQRPDGYHFLELVISTDDVISKKAGAMLVAMACEHAGIVTTPSTTVEEIVPVLQAKLTYSGVPIFELVTGGDVLTIGDKKVRGTLVPVLDEDGNQLIAATGHVPVAVMPEGEHYGKSIRGNVEVSSSPWAIVPNGLPLPEVDQIFHLLDQVGCRASVTSTGSDDFGFGGYDQEDEYEGF